MKKGIAFVLAASMAFGVVACGNTNNENTPNQQEQTQEDTDNKETQEGNTTDETKELAEFDITGDGFINIMNKLLESTHPDLVLSDFKTEESKDGKHTIYYIYKNNILISYTINKDTNNVCFFDTTVKNDVLNEDTYANILYYFMTAMTALQLKEDTDTLLENLNLADYTSKTDEFYPTDEANYVKLFSDDAFTLGIQAPNTNS